MTEPHEHALAGSVRAENHRSRPRRELAGDAVDDRSVAGDKRHVLEDQRKHHCLPIAADRRRFDDLRRRIDGEHHGHEDDAEAQRERQVPFACLE